MAKISNKPDKVKVGDKIVWECLKDKKVEHIAEDLGYEGEIDYSRYEEICKKQEEMLGKYGVNLNNRWFNVDIWEEEDAKEYNGLIKEGEDEWKRIHREYTDKCIDWLMEKGYKLVVGQEARGDCFSRE